MKVRNTRHIANTRILINKFPTYFLKDLVGVTVTHCESNSGTLESVFMIFNFKIPRATNLELLRNIGNVLVSSEAATQRCSEEQVF